MGNWCMICRALLTELGCHPLLEKLNSMIEDEAFSLCL